MLKIAIIMIVNSLLFTSVSLFAKEKLTIAPKALYDEHLKNKVITDSDKIIDAFKKNQLVKTKAYKYNVSNSKEKLVANSTTVEAEVSAVINPLDTNNIVLSPIHFTGIPNEGLLCPIYYTLDFGKTWNKSSFKSLPPKNCITEMGGDPVLSFDKNGHVHLVWMSVHGEWDFSQTPPKPKEAYSTLLHAKSTNKGKDWVKTETPIVSISAAYGSLKNLNDKPWIAFDHTSSASGNNFYLSLTEVDLSNTALNKLKLFKKENTENSFNKKGKIINSNSYELNHFTNIDVDNKGQLHVTFWGQKNNKNYIYHALSKDNGNSFEPETVVSEMTISSSHLMPSPNTIEKKIGLNSTRLYLCQQLAIDKSKKSSQGNLYCTWTADGIDKSGTRSLDIYFSRSTNDGKSWSTPIILDREETLWESSQFYSSISVNSEGIVAVSWYDRRNDFQDRNTDVYVAYSFNNGKSFQRGIKVNTSPTDYDEVLSNTNNNFGIGEYTSLLTTKGHAIPVWTDGRKNNGDLNIYVAFVPIGVQTSGVESISPVSGNVMISSISPNPAKNSALLSYSLRSNTDVNVTVYDALGNAVFSKEIMQQLAGKHDIQLQLTNLAAGNYYCRVKTEKAYAVKKLIILK